MATSVSWQNVQRDYLRNRKNAKLYLQVAMEDYEQDGDMEMLSMVLREIADAQGGLAKLAARTNLSRQSLYKALSPKGNPTLSTLRLIFHNLGLQMKLVPIKPTRKASV